jgi:hypothetical protein
MPPPPFAWTVDDDRESDLRAGDRRVQGTWLTKIQDHLINKKRGFCLRSRYASYTYSIFVFLPRPLLRISRVVSYILEDIQMRLTQITA